MVSPYTGLTALIIGVSLCVSSARSECSDIHLVAASTLPSSSGLGSEDQQFLTDLADALPSKTASVFIASQQTSSGLVSEMAQHIVAYANSCAGAEYVIGGYSQAVNVTELTLGVKASLGDPSSSIAQRVKASLTLDCDGNAYCLRGSSSAKHYGVTDSNPFGVL